MESPSDINYRTAPSCLLHQLPPPLLSRFSPPLTVILYHSSSLTTKAINHLLLHVCAPPLTYSPPSTATAASVTTNPPSGPPTPSPTLSKTKRPITCRAGPLQRSAENHACGHKHCVPAVYDPMFDLSEAVDATGTMRCTYGPEGLFRPVWA
ncbi:hypothetical protein EX30DRAFT_242038 [Ascodesmis nigricans]|uniref:Uncharacterized protein n=1 Tax=Ascodesmis nigricans TaxID=341454 RepID=A0A4S2MZ65_9PEZI|nr:hypothetical protein EX30DRAFT_242038 [Ascodesmis nigricans]